MFLIYWETSKYLQKKKEVLHMLLKIMKLSVAFTYTIWGWKISLETLIQCQESIKMDCNSSYRCKTEWKYIRNRFFFIYLKFKLRVVLFSLLWTLKDLWHKGKRIWWLLIKLYSVDHSSCSSFFCFLRAWILCGLSICPLII